MAGLRYDLVIKNVEIDNLEPLAQLASMLDTGDDNEFVSGEDVVGLMQFICESASAYIQDDASIDEPETQRGAIVFNGAKILRECAQALYSIAKINP